MQIKMKQKDQRILKKLEDNILCQNNVNRRTCVWFCLKRVAKQI